MENKKYLDKVIGSLVRSTRIDYENKLISFPWLTFPLGFVDLKIYFDSKDPHNSRPNFHNYCTNTFGLSSDEMKFVHDKLNFIFKDKLKNLYDLPISKFNRLNESSDGNFNFKYLDKVMESLVRGTKIDNENDVVYSPFITLPKRAFYNHLLTRNYISIHGLFGYLKNTFGLNSDEVLYIWEQYKEIMLEKINNGE